MSVIVRCGGPEMHTAAGVNAIHKHGGVVEGWTRRVCPSCGVAFTAPIQQATERDRQQVVRMRGRGGKPTFYLQTRQGLRRLQETPVPPAERTSP